MMHVCIWFGCYETTGEIHNRKQKYVEFPRFIFLGVCVNGMFRCCHGVLTNLRYLQL